MAGAAAGLAMAGVFWIGATLDAAALSETPAASSPIGPLGGRGPGMFLAAGELEQLSNHPNCRFGVGGGVDGYDVAALNAGWTMDWSAQIDPPRPGGAEYVQLVRLQPELDGYSFTPETSTLQAILAANPGSTWLIGNEPDSPFQDRLQPELYARAYHDLYDLIKQDDPSARVGAGGIVQPTPLRFQYLNRFVAAYEQYYGERPPADLWNIHSYILREIDVTDPQACQAGQSCTEPPYGVWGAYIPPGITATRGILYKYSEMFSTAIFRQRLIDFRTWMRDNGYRDTPLHITEYGELFPYPPFISGHFVDELGAPITEQRVAAFMTGTFGLLRTVTDTNVGHPADADRLVQRWLWYSISDGSFGGPLFNPATGQRTLLGDVFYSYTHAITPGVDLLAVRVETEPPVLIDSGGLQTVTLKALISNAGNVSVTQPVVVAFYAGTYPTGTLIRERTVTPPLEGCAATVEVSAPWRRLGPGAHPMYVLIDPGDTVTETTKANNQATGVTLVATQRVFLPRVFKSYAHVP